MNDTNVCDSENGLTAAQFDKLLRHLGPDRVCAAERYETLRLKLTRYFEWNRCMPAEDLVDETLDRVAKRLGDTDIEDVASYALGVARFIRMEAHRHAAKIVPLTGAPEEEPIFSKLRVNACLEDELHEERERQRRRACLLACIRQLSTADRGLLLAYYSPERNIAETRHKLARRLGISMGALRVRLTRLRERLEKLTAEHMASLASKPRARPAEAREGTT